MSQEYSPQDDILWEGRIEKLVEVLAAYAPQLQSLKYRDPCIKATQPRLALPPQLGQLSQLTKLDIGIESASVSTTEINAMLGNLPSLQHLRLQFRRYIYCLEREFFLGVVTSCAELKHLRIDGVWVQNAFPSEIGFLTRLTSLFLKYCDPLALTLPDSISQLTDLQALNLEVSSGCMDMSALPPSLTACQQLTSLVINNHQESPVLAKLQSLRFLSHHLVGTENDEDIFWPHLTGLTVLMLEFSFPDDVNLTGLAGMTSLCSLAIRYALPCRLPPGPYLSRLGTLRLEECSFDDGLPACLAAATQLHDLYIFNESYFDGNIDLSDADIAILIGIPLDRLVLQKPRRFTQAVWDERLTLLRVAYNDKGRIVIVEAWDSK